MACGMCKGTQGTIGLRPVVIEDAVGDVGMLLDFAEKHAGTDGVRGSRGDEEGISGLHGKPR